MSKVSKTARKLEWRKQDLARKKKGMKFMLAFLVIVWALYFFESMLPQELPWYQSLFHLLLPGMMLLSAIMGLNIATEHVNILIAEGQDTAPMMAKWAKICGLCGIPGLLIYAACFLWVQAAPGIAFALTAFPFGISAGLGIAFWRSRKDQARPDWEFGSMISGICSLVLLGLAALVSYLMGDLYDAHYSISVWGVPAGIFTIVCVVHWRNAHKAAQPPKLTVIEGGKHGGIGG